MVAVDIAPPRSADAMPQIDIAPPRSADAMPQIDIAPPRSADAMPQVGEEIASARSVVASTDLCSASR